MSFAEEKKLKILETIPFAFSEFQKSFYTKTLEMVLNIAFKGKKKLHFAMDKCFKKDNCTSEYRENIILILD